LVERALLLFRRWKTMSAYRNHPNVFTDRLAAVAGSSLFVLFFILALVVIGDLSLAQDRPARRLTTARQATAGHTPSSIEFVQSKSDEFTSGSEIQQHANKLFDYTYTQIHMAMPVRITVWSQDERRARQAGRAAFNRISELVRVLSKYEPESELNRLLDTGGVETRNRARGVSPDLLAVLSYSKLIYQLTNGAFDPSAGPIIDLWKKSRKAKTLPSQAELDMALSRVGFDQIKIDGEDGKVRVLRSGVQLDLGAIAKGYIADQALEVLGENGIDSACIEAGGDFVVSQSPPGTSGWGIDVPALGVMHLENCGISVSGDTVQFAEIDSIRYSHVVDPRTGKPLTNRIMAVVIAPRAIQSDALATSACLLEGGNFEDIVKGMPGVQYWRWRASAKDSESPAESE
jgi:thiamine biosynthesis lipoprotein